MRNSLLDLMKCPFCGGRFNRTVMDGAAGETEYGLLECYCGKYPVIAGIPVLKKDPSGELDRIVRILESGRHREALLEMITPAELKQKPQAAARRIFNLVRAGIHGDPAKRWKARASELLWSGSGRLTACDLLSFYFRDKDIFYYFAYRQSQPRYLVGLSFASLVKGAGPVLDLACGCGHLTGYLAKNSGRDVAGIDEFFFGLYMAKHWIAPAAEYVCCRADSTLPFSGGAFSSVFCSDAFHYFGNKAGAVREMKRLLTGKGLMLFAWVHNALRRRAYDGSPLPPAGYASLFEGMNYSIVSANDVLERYLRKKAPALLRFPGASVENEPLLCMAASTGREIEGDYGEFEEWPHAQGDLGLNPIYSKNARLNGRMHLRRSFPSAGYEREHPESKRYLPEEIEIRPQALSDLKEGRRTAEINKLIGDFAVTAMPRRYMEW